MATLLLPKDPHDVQLAANVHPSDWINPAPKPKYHLVVLGAGTAGLVTAAIGAALGAKVALVERHLMGGDCLNSGCVPSKALIRSARAAAQCRDAASFGIHLSSKPETDFATVMERVRRLRSGISHHDSARRFKELGVDVFIGDAKFTGPASVSVGGAALNFRSAVIATGARPAIPSIPGLADSGYLTHESVFALTKLPASLAIIGGGPIGCEIAQSFARLGSRVILIESEAHFLPREDSDAAEILRKSLERDGIEIRLAAQIESVKTQCDSRRITVRSPNGSSEIEVEHIFVGAGRTPNIESLDLNLAGVKSDPTSGIGVNDALQTSNPRIYAAGDVCLPFKFTHAADFAARIVVQNALFSFFPKKKFSSLIIPWCTYTDPEIAHVGAYPKQLTKQGIAFDTITQRMSQVDRAILDGETEGFVKIHVSADGRGTILGATIVASHAGDMISQITQAMVRRIPLGAISLVVHPYPTQAEAIRKAADQCNKRRLTPSRQKALRWILDRML